MEDKVISVDIEKIMEEIRAKIAERGETEDIIAFYDYMEDQSYLLEFEGLEQYVDTVLHHYVYEANMGHNIPFYQMIPAGGIKSFIKRAIRKLISPTVLPLRDAQNRYNANVVQALMQLEAYSLEKTNVINNQKKTIDQLTERIKQLEVRCDALEKKNS